MSRDVRYEVRAGGMVSAYESPDDAVNTARALPEDSRPTVVLQTRSVGVDTETPFWPKVGETVMTLEGYRQTAIH